MDLFTFAAQADPTLFEAANPLAQTAKNNASILRAVDDVAAALNNGHFDRKVLDAIMTQAFAGTDASGAWNIQQAYNALEGGLAICLRDSGGVLTTATIRKYLDQVPAQNRRTAEKDALQQFSTPPTIGLVAATLAQISPHDTVLEPSAGTGLLGLLAARIGATLIINEIDAERLQVAKHVLQPAHSHGFDAKYLSVYGKRLGAAPSVVLMNPPFSADIHATNSAEVGLQHVYQAATLLRPGGRLVAILADFQHPASRAALWTRVTELCSIRAAYNITGQEFHKLGTDFSVCVVMLDKALGLDPVAMQTQPASVDEILASIPTIERLDVGTARTVDTALLAVDIGKRALRTYTPIFAGVETINYRAAAPIEREDEGIFVQYAPYLEIEGAKPHPEPLVESAALACVRPPTPSVPLRLPTSMRDRVSVAQLESAIYAAYAHSQEIELLEHNPDGTAHAVTARRGVMFGHGTGFGKGRTMATIIASNFVEGRTKAMWLSETQDLFEDTQRDVHDVFGPGHEEALFNVSDTPANSDIVREHGILFSTYATLRSEGRQGSRSRLDQVTQWAGTDFAGVIILDESHNLANAAEGEGTRGKTKASKQAIAAIELQRRFPDARLVYTSATSASKLEAFLYAPRMGLWGPNTAFATQEQFVNQLSSGGTAAMELLCRDAKALGVYLASNLSMAAVTYERLEHELTVEQIEQYDAIASAWLIIDREARRILEDTDAGGLARAAALSKLESTRLRCLQSVLVTAKLPTVIRNIEDALQNDKSVAIQITNTYEAAQERALAKLGDDDGGDLDDLDLSPKEQIFGYLDQAFPVMQYTERVVNGKTISEPLLDDEGNQIASPDAIEAREALKKHISSLIIPLSPLDILLDHFGTEITAEVTGRKRRVVTKIGDHGERNRAIEARSEHANSAETELFMSGRKRILIFSEAAGGTGRSYHAARTCGNQQQRYHYLLQTGWRSDRAIQGLGRTHRTNQAFAPHWVLCTTDAPGERRFISTIARRLQELGACTRGQRDAAGTGLFTAADNLETEYTYIAITTLIRQIAANKCDLIPYELWLEYTNFDLQDDRDGRPKTVNVPVSRFLNKMLASPLFFQRNMMDLLIEQLEITLEAAKTAGTFDNGIETLDALAIARAKSQTIYKDELSGATTDLLTLEAEYNTKTVSFGHILSKVREQRERYPHLKSEFIQNNGTGTIHAVYAVANTWTDDRGAVQPYWKVVSPGHSDTVKTRPFYGYQHVDDDKANALWNKEFESIGPTVKVPVYIVSGTLLPIYDRLPNDFAQVVRVTLDDGERVIGRVIKETHLQPFLEKFNMAETPDVDTILARLQQRCTLRLSNGYMLRQVRFMDDLRIECVVARHQALADAPYLRAIGIINERVNYEHRFFLPAGDEGAILAKLLERNAVTFLAAAVA
jgi:hypothetical protein